MWTCQTDFRPKICCWLFNGVFCSGVQGSPEISYAEPNLRLFGPELFITAYCMNCLSHAMNCVHARLPSLLKDSNILNRLHIVATHFVSGLRRLYNEARLDRLTLFLLKRGWVCMDLIQVPDESFVKLRIAGNCTSVKALESFVFLVNPHNALPDMVVTIDSNNF